MRYSSRDHGVGVRDSRGVYVGDRGQQNNFFENRKVVISLGAFGAALVIGAALFLFAAPITSLVDEIRASIATASLKPGPDEGRAHGSAGNDAATAEPYRPAVPKRAKVSLTPTAGAKTGSILVSGRYFQPGEDVSVTVHMYEAALVKADADGSFSTRIQIPSDTFCPSDQCTVQAQGKDSIKWNDATYTLR